MPLPYFPVPIADLCAQIQRWTVRANTIDPR